MPETDDNVLPLERIRRYRIQMSRQRIARRLYTIGQFSVEASTVLAILGRGLRLMARELGYEEPRRIRLSDWGD